MKTLLVLVVLVLIAAGAFLYFNDDTAPIYDGEDVACTMEAKLCPDGSYVGRGGPNCEFAPCPTAGTSTM